MFGLRPPPYALARTVAPSEEPLSLAEAKAWLRVEDSVTADDAKIAALIVAARVEAERISGRRLCASTFRMTLDRFPFVSGPCGPSAAWTDRLADSYGLAVGLYWPTIRLPGSPVTAVSSVQYYDLDEALQTLSSSSWQFSADYEPALLVVRFPPPTYPRPDAVRITYAAGVAASAVSENVKLAMKFAIAQWYESAAGESPASRWVEQESMPRAAVAILSGEWDGELSGGR